MRRILLGVVAAAVAYRPGSLMMERTMLRGIKARAERLAAQPAPAG